MAENPFGIDANGNPTANFPGSNEYPNTNSTITGPRNCAGGQHVDAATGQCVNDEATTNTVNVDTPAPGNERNAIAGDYAKFLGRTPTEADWATIDWSQPFGAIENGIANSPEADAYNKAHKLGNYAILPGNTPAPASPMSFLGGGATAAPARYTGPTYQFNPYTGPDFTPYQFAKPGTFNAGPTNQATQDLIMHMLSNTALSPAVIAQMKEGQKSTILSGADQLRQQILQDAARRGVSGGGTVEGELAGLGESSLSDISKAYSGIDVAAAQTDFANKQAAAAAATQFQNQLLQAFLGQENLNLSTEEQQAQQKEKESAFGLQKYTTEEAFKNQAASSAFGQWLQSQGLDLSFLQNAQTNGLNIAKFLANGQ